RNLLPLLRRVCVTKRLHGMATDSLDVITGVSDTTPKRVDGSPRLLALAIQHIGRVESHPFVVVFHQFREDGDRNLKFSASAQRLGCGGAYNRTFLVVVCCITKRFYAPGVLLLNRAQTDGRPKANSGIVVFQPTNQRLLAVVIAARR